VKSGLVQELVFAVVLNWTALVTMTSNRLIIRACALRSYSKSLVLGAFAQEEQSQLLQLLLGDDAKPTDAQGDSGDFSKGSGNGGDSDKVGCASCSNTLVALLGHELAQPKRVLF
jgi:hypothetical protein